jgi:hypothetical protein
MAKQKASKPETKSDFLRRVLSRNPELDYQKVNRRWARAGHAGQISNALYYQVRAKLGIKTEWVWVKESELYTLEVFLLSGPVTKTFAKKNPVVSRTIMIRGDQTLEDLHHAIFDAFGRWEEHMYEFQFGKGPMDPKAHRYVLPGAFQIELGEENPPAGRVNQTRIDSLGLEVGRRFGYWFDFGDDWWHQINVEAIEHKAPASTFPRVSKRVGKSPPQYAEEDE